MILGSTVITEKQTGDKGKDDFENLLREIDAEISGKVDTECIVDTTVSERIMEGIMGSAQQKEAQRGEFSTHGLGTSCSYNGPQVLMGHLQDQGGSDGPKATLTHTQDSKASQGGPMKSAISGKCSNKRGKSPTRRKPQVHANKSGKENVGLCKSILQKKNEREEASQMEVEELDMGPKRKLWAPLSEVEDNKETGKKLKLDEEVVALEKLMATQMGSAAAAGQPRREQ
nr:hypothetical protein CFP56_55674 [Quercus suber]